MCKQMSSGLFKILSTNYLFTNHMYLVYICRNRIWGDKTYIFIYRPIGIMVRGFAMILGTRVQFQVKSFQKWYLIYIFLLSTQHYKLQIKGKWSNPGKGVAAFPTPQCCSNWKGSLRVSLNYGWPTSTTAIYFLCLVDQNIYWRSWTISW